MYKKCNACDQIISDGDWFIKPNGTRNRLDDKHILNKGKCMTCELKGFPNDKLEKNWKDGLWIPL